ncbi:hypothetical protein ACJJTC_017157 [Scirpophaga incertulas]
MNKVAIDCEMVGDINNHAMLAYVALVDTNLGCIYKTFVQPINSVHYFRNTGITSSQLASGKTFSQVQNEVQRLIAGKLLIGHSVSVDLQALGIRHPESQIRDIADRYKVDGKSLSLKILARDKLGEDIQTGNFHDPEEDAKAAMKIYKRYPW